MIKLNVKEWDKYNKLTIIKEVYWYNKRYFKCKCECWNTKIIYIYSITSWKTKTCWCLHKEKFKYVTHSMSNDRIYEIWSWIKKRCDNIKNHAYKYYWWRWITYDPKWEKFEWFYKDMIEWYSDNLTIDRIDNNWNYCKENCRWATDIEQARNMRTNIIYKWKCIGQWMRELWLSRKRILTKIKKNII